MTTRIAIPQGERGLVRLFAVDLPPAEARSFAEDAPASVARALGTQALGARHVEVIDIADLKGVGLTGYLEQGIGVAPAALADMRGELEALSGRVALVLSAAFDGGATLTVGPPLRLIATFPEAEPGTPEIPLATPSAEGTPMAPTARPVPVSSPRGAVWVLLLLGVVALILLALLL